MEITLNDAEVTVLRDALKTRMIALNKLIKNCEKENQEAAKMKVLEQISTLDNINRKIV